MTVSTRTSKPALVPPDEFIGLDDCMHFYSGAEGPLLRRSAEALLDYIAQKGRGEAGRKRHAEVTLQCRQDTARLLGVNVQDIALLSSATEGINAVYGLADFQLGDNVVINNLEFPTVSLCALRLKERGVDVRVVRHRDWEIPTGALLSAVDARTKLVALSHVSYINGLRHDLGVIGEALRSSGAMFLVDATQSLGVLPIPVEHADFVVASSYKWLLGTHGLGVLYWNRKRRPDAVPAVIGRHSVSEAFGPDRYDRYALKDNAGRFETAYCSLPPVYALSQSLPRLLDVGTAEISTHALELGARLICGLKELGFTVITPMNADRRGASVSFTHESPLEIGQALSRRQIHVWCGDHRVRVSVHLFCSEDDIERLLDVLAELRPARSGSRVAEA